MNQGNKKKKHMLAVCMIIILVALTACDNQDNNTDDATGTKITQTAVAKGYGGDVSVTVDVQDEKITAITAQGPSETEAIGGKAIADYNSQLFQTLIGKSVNDANADSLDTISGATVTSEAVKEALKEALSKTK